MIDDFQSVVVLIMLNVVNPDAELAVESENEDVMVQHTGWGPMDQVASCSDQEEAVQEEVVLKMVDHLGLGVLVGPEAAEHLASVTT